MASMTPRCVVVGVLWMAAGLGCLGDDSGEPGSGATDTTGAVSSETGTTMAPSTDPATSLPATSESTTQQGSTAAGTSTAVSSSDTGRADTGSTTGGGVLCDGEFPEEWANGTACGAEEPIQVHRYDENTFILRQSLCTSFEGPFLYLLFGEDRVLLEDTGDGGIPVQATVQSIIDQWLTEQGKESIELVVANSHAHGDHVAGNSQFVGQPNTTVVGYGVSDRASYFGITDWPNEIVQFDLGGRVLDIIPIPGHESSHIAIYDPEEGLLLTGDALYSGRLYIADFAAYVEGIDRLVQHVSTREVCWVLGTHIEMTNTPGVDYDFGADEHPDEHPLQLQIDHLLELQAALAAMANPTYEIHDDFIIYPL